MKHPTFHYSVPSPRKYTQRHQLSTTRGADSGATRNNTILKEFVLLLSPQQVLIDLALSDIHSYPIYSTFLIDQAI